MLQPIYEDASEVIDSLPKSEKEAEFEPQNIFIDQLGRFSAEYKNAFGELPSATLTR